MAPSSYRREAWRKEKNEGGGLVGDASRRFLRRKDTWTSAYPEGKGGFFFFFFFEKEGKYFGKGFLQSSRRHPHSIIESRAYALGMLTSRIDRVIYEQFSFRLTITCQHCVTLSASPDEGHHLSSRVVQP